MSTLPMGIGLTHQHSGIQWPQIREGSTQANVPGTLGHRATVGYLMSTSHVHLQVPSEPCLVLRTQAQGPTLSHTFLSLTTTKEHTSSLARLPEF